MPQRPSPRPDADYPVRACSQRTTVLRSRPVPG
jgi:hypothetical protein